MQVTVHLPPVQSVCPLQKHLASSVPSRKALKLPEVVEAIKAECDAMPMACNQWTIDVHDQLLSTFNRQLLERHATAVPGLPRKPWVNEAVSKLLQAHAEARRSYRSALSSLRCARLRVSFLAWAVCPR